MRVREVYGSWLDRERVGRHGSETLPLCLLDGTILLAMMTKFLNINTSIHSA